MEVWQSMSQWCNRTSNSLWPSVSRALLDNGRPIETHYYLTPYKYLSEVCKYNSISAHTYTDTVIQRGMEQKYEQFKGQSRLPKFAIPRRYDLTLKPDLSSCTFGGDVEIDVHISKETKFLVLNALDLAIDGVWFRASHHRVGYPSDVSVDNDDEILVLAFDDVLTVGDGTLGIKLSGVLNEHLEGILQKYLCGRRREEKHGSYTIRSCRGKAVFSMLG